MFHPLIGQRRRCGAAAFLALAAAEYAAYLVVSVPLYAVAARLSDATVTDVVRGVLYLTAVECMALGLGLWVRSGRLAFVTAAVLAGALIAVAVPAVYYFLIELTDFGASAAWLRDASPVTCAFNLAGSRGGGWWPAPAWAWALWPAGGMVLGFASLLHKPGERKPGEREEK